MIKTYKLILLLFFMFEIQQNSHANTQGDFWNDFLSKQHHYELTGCMINDIDMEKEECKKDSKILFDFSVQNGSINYKQQIKGSITINDTKYENIHGNMMFDRYGAEGFFFIYDSNNNNIINFATKPETHDFFVQLSYEDANELLEFLENN